MNTPYNPFAQIDARLSNIETLLLDIKHSPTRHAQTDSDQWFDIDELRNYLPDKPSKATIYLWKSENTIPYHKHKGVKKLRFLKSEIDAWLQQGKQKTNEEIGEQLQSFLKTKKGGTL